MSTEARVGIVAVVAVALFIAVVVYLAGPATREPGYPLRGVFPSAEGVFAGTPVTIAGVQVGAVREVRLTPENRAEVVMRIRPGVRIPEGSTAAIATSGLLGDRLIVVVPGPADAPALPPGAQIEGSPGFSIESVYARLDQVASQVSDLIASVDQTVRNVNLIIGDPELFASLRRAVGNVEAATARLNGAVGTDVVATARNLREMSASLVATADSLDRFVSQITEDPTLLRQVKETVASVHRTSRQVEQMAAAARGVVNEEQARQVREVIAGARQVVDQARSVLGRVEGAVNTVTGVIRPPERLLRLEYELWYAGRRFQSDVDVFLPQDASTYWLIGLRDLGGQNLLTLQRATLLSPVLSYRVGVIESQLGLGLDYRASPLLGLGAEVFNPSRLTLNLYARYAVDPTWTVTLNARYLLQQPVIGLGVRRRF